MKELIGLALALFAASWVIYNAIKFINLRNKKQEVKDMVKKKLEVYILKKKHGYKGNPIYQLFIPKLSGKHKGLKKLKQPHTYSVEAYSVKRHLEWALPKYKIVIVND